MIIENLYHTIITCDKYNVNTESNSTVTVTITCLDFNGEPVIGEEIKLYYDNTLLTTSTTDSNGVITYSYNCNNDDFGLHTFSTDNGAVAQIEVYRDTGWIGVTYKSGYKDYTGYTTSYRVYNNIVEISGIFYNNNAITPGSDGINFASIPSKYAPLKPVYSLEQGTGANKFLLSMDTSGTLKIARYGTTAITTQATAGSWLHCYLKYLLD